MARRTDGFRFSRKRKPGHLGSYATGEARAYAEGTHRVDARCFGFVQRGCAGLTG